jgi:hypothetical protein
VVALGALNPWSRRRLRSRASSAFRRRFDATVARRSNREGAVKILAILATSGPRRRATTQGSSFF